MSVASGGGSVEDQIEREYELIQKIGTGSFGYVISVRNKQDGRLYACKIEKNHGKRLILVEKEFQIMLDLMGTGHFPQVYALQKLKENSYIIMEKLDNNLEELFALKKKKFSLPTIALITEQCFTGMRLLHEAGYLHRDLKPQNFMIKSISTHQIKLIDFGLSDGMRVKRASTLIGNVRFSSRDAHFGYSSRKDDLESLVFVLFYLMTGSLPWQSATKEQIEMEINRKAETNSNVDTPILQAKHDFIQKLEYPPTKNQIKKIFYSELADIFRYVFELGRDAEPDYVWIGQRCDRLMLLAGTRRGGCFDWCRQNCNWRKRQELWDIFQE